MVDWTQGRNTWSAKAMVTSLRAFLRFAHATGRTAVPLAGAVPAVASWRMSSLPRGPEGGGDRAAAGRLRPGHGGGPAGLRGPVAAGPARPAGCRGRRAAARRHRLAGRRDRGHGQGQQDRAAPAAGPGRGGARRLAGARAAEVRVAVGVRDGPAALPAADAGVGPGRHGQGLRAGRPGAAGNAPVPALAGDRDAAGRGVAARGRAGAAAPQPAVHLDLCQGRPERAAPAGPPVAREPASERAAGQGRGVPGHAPGPGVQAGEPRAAADELRPVLRGPRRRAR